MWFESIHVRIRLCMLTQTDFLSDFLSVSLWPVCYLLIENRQQRNANISSHAGRQDQDVWTYDY